MGWINNILYLVFIRLQQEITEVLGDRTEVTNEDLDNLQFTDQVNIIYVQEIILNRKGNIEYIRILYIFIIEIMRLFDTMDKLIFKV